MGAQHVEDLCKGLRTGCRARDRPVVLAFCPDELPLPRRHAGCRQRQDRGAGDAQGHAQERHGEVSEGACPRACRTPVRHALGVIQHKCLYLFYRV